MGEKIITVLSNASLDHYPENKISNFRNKLYSPISLTDGDYEIALLGCSYNASKVIVAENQEIGKYFNPGSDTEQVLKAPFSMSSFEQIFSLIKEVTGHEFKIEAYGFVTFTNRDPKNKSFTFSQRLADVLGITAVRYETKFIDLKKHKYRISGSETPYKLPIHYTGKDILYWLPLKAGESEPVPMRATKATTFDELMTEFPRNSDEKTVKIGENKWQVTMPINERVKFNNCKETELIRHKQGTVTFTVEHSYPDLFYKKGDLLVIKKETGERILCSRDLLSYREVLLEYERLWPGLIVHLNIHNKITLTMSSDNAEYDTDFMRIEHSFKLLRYLGTMKYLTNAFDLSDLKTYTGAYRPVSNLGTSQLLLYCDLIHPQHIGNTVAPLLRSFQIEYEGAEHIFHSPLYFPITRDYVDVIHMYIMCENGEPPPFEFGTFTATLGIRKKVSY